MDTLRRVKLAPLARGAAWTKRTCVAAPTAPDEQRYCNRGDYERHMTPAHWLARARSERAYADSFGSDGAIPGFCSICAQQARFRFAPGTGDDPPNWRESLHCDRCGLFSRIRFSLDQLRRNRPLEGTRVYITEQTTPVYAWLRRSGAHVRGSEYVTDPARRAVLDGYVRHITEGADTALDVEDVTRLSFVDASQEAVLSFDVLEHVPDFRAALREFRRVLAPEGTLIFTVPFDVNRDTTLVRARVGADGAIEHLVEPEYHGDPTTSDGCLAFRTFGWDLLDEVRVAGFGDVHVASNWDPAHGYLGSQLTFVASVASAAPESSYDERIARERAIFDGRLNVHDLPAIYHYWSNRHLLPMAQALGFDHPYDFFARALAEAAQRFRGPLKFVSLGAGNCDAEIDIALRLRALGVSDFTIECLDLSGPMLARGVELARERDVESHIVPLQTDFNRWSPQRIYHAVIANQSLHHVLELEHLFDAVAAALLPDARFVVSDMIGRNGHLRWPEARAVLDELWRELPESHRFNLQLQRQETEFQDWDCSTEGFEGIRAQDILPLCIERFGFELFLPFANVIDPFIDRGFGHHFDAAGEWDRAFIDRVHARDEAEILAGRITPTHMMAIMTNDRGARPRIRAHLTPEFCVRRT